MTTLKPLILTIIKKNPLNFDKLVKQVNDETKVDKDKIENRIYKLISLGVLEIHKGIISLSKPKRFLVPKEEFGKLIRSIEKRTRVRECVHPDKSNCSEKIIKAHSIQNNGILSRIAKDGEVMQIKLEDAISTGDLSKVGRKSASTFTGFCGKHDNDTFKPIEQKNYELGNKEQEFLFAYRAFTREFIIKQQSQNMILEAIKLKGSNQYQEGIHYYGEIAIRELYHIKSKFDESLFKKEYGLIETKQITLDKEYLISVCSMFSIEFDFEGNLINDLSDEKTKMKNIFLTIFPQDGKTYILISYFKKDSITFNFLNSQLIDLDESEQITKINLLVVSYCENFVYSPEKWEKISKSEKEEFMKLFIKSMNIKNPTDLSKKAKFNLFQ